MEKSSLTIRKHEEGMKNLFNRADRLPYMTCVPKTMKTCLDYIRMLISIDVISWIMMICEGLLLEVKLVS